MKVQSSEIPEQIWIRKNDGKNIYVKLRKNIEEKTREDEEGTSIYYEYDEVEVVLPKMNKPEEYIEQNFDDIWFQNTTEMAREVKGMIPIKLKTDKQQIETDGTDTATITGEIPTDFEKVHVMVNSPPPVYEEINDGEIEIEFTTEDEGFHVIEVTAGNHWGLIVIEGVSSSG